MDAAGNDPEAPLAAFTVPGVAVDISGGPQLVTPIKVPVVNIGRGDYNDIVIADSSVSRRHARVSRAENGFVVR